MRKTNLSKKGATTKKIGFLAKTLNLKANYSDGTFDIVPTNIGKREMFTNRAFNNNILIFNLFDCDTSCDGGGCSNDSDSCSDDVYGRIDDVDGCTDGAIVNVSISDNLGGSLFIHAGFIILGHFDKFIATILRLLLIKFYLVLNELDKTLAEYDCSVSDSVLKTKLLANDANAASIRTRVPVRKPGINNADLFKEPLSYHHKTLSVPNLMANPASPNMPPPPPPPPPTVPSISHRTHCSKNRSMLALSPAYSDIYSSPDMDPCHPQPTANNSMEPPVDYDQETNLVMMAPKNATSPLTPRQLKQRNSAKRTSTIQKSDCQFLQGQKFDQEFLQTSKDLFLRYPTAKISISVSDGDQPRQIEIDRQMFDKLYKSQQPQTPIRTTSVLTALNSFTLNSSLPSSSSPSSVSSASSAYDTAMADTPPLGLNEAIKKAALEHQKRQSDKTACTTNASRTPNVKNELEKALENRLKRLSVLQAESEHEAPSFPPPPSPGALNKLNEQSGAPERVCSPPPPPPPLPPLTAACAQSARPATLKTTVKSLVNTYQLIDPRSSSDFGELIAKKAAEKRAKFHENKPVLSSVTYQPDGTKVVNAFKPNEELSVKNNTALLHKANAQLANDSAQATGQNNDSESEMNPNQESFITTASKLLEKAKQKQHSIDTNKPDQKPTPVAASAQNSLKIK
ncbi:hypothetical protein BpHYR1_031297 [Brachionus plicatilis]|uniref:Uncharacterized protein n=1 Tax=Brachionus plicatilis TaxID=10195 RepID=A0A3M7T6T1_BRAPC|nr:hypothetical protein BpHYR1_031297 [Brachionus plicatilis]